MLSNNFIGKYNNITTKKIDRTAAAATNAIILTIISSSNSFIYS